MPTLRISSGLRSVLILFVGLLLIFLSAVVLMSPGGSGPSAASSLPEPLVALHVSELTQALETIPATPPTPTGPGTTGYEWFYTSWHYFVAYESLKEALRSDGTPFVEISDADIAAGLLLRPDGSPKYPILISLASEAVDESEIEPLRTYVGAGGLLFVGSSAFTRNPDGTTRGDFAVANEMGVHMVNASLENWAENWHVTRIADHPLTSHIPQGTVRWRMPLTSDEIYYGVSPDHGPPDGVHYVWQVTAAPGTTVLANWDTGPLLTTSQYGKGRVIYHGALQPILGIGGWDPGMYAYLIYRNAIQWAFETANLPLVRLSPWRYQYDAAFVVRHDFENWQWEIRSLENSALFESLYGAKGDYYFCTGTLREEMPDRDEVVASLRRAVADYGATIGSHNGGLPNPVNPDLEIGDYDYWHWGPDEALDVTPPGYPSGKAYAQDSVSISFEDIEGWLAGLDNGRAGCGSLGTCPRTWSAPYFNGTREDSFDLLEALEVITLGEQKTGPFPHWTLSTRTPGKRYGHISLPTSDWFVAGDIAQSLEYHSTSTMEAAIDFYYGLGALINMYNHHASAEGTLQGDYVAYCASKPRIWSANAVDIYDWWTVRSAVAVSPSYSQDGTTGIARATVSGVTDPDTAIEICPPHFGDLVMNSLEVFIDGSPADPADYRATTTGVKVRVGPGSSTVEVRYLVFDLWTQTTWSGGAGQDLWVDETRFKSASGVDHTVEGEIALETLPPGAPLFQDDFTRPPDPPLPWVTESGTWTVDSGVLQGTCDPQSYAYIYASDSPPWTDYTVEGRIRFPAGGLGGGVGGRLDPGTGAHYGAWIYPGDNQLKLVKFHDWTTWSFHPMQTVVLSPIGTGWHTLRMTFKGNRILVYYDGQLQIDATDNGFDSLPAYSSGGISVEMGAVADQFDMLADDILVTPLPSYVSSGELESSAFDGGSGVQWQAISWDATTGADTSVCVRTRSADQASQLVNMPWSACYDASGSHVASENRRWIQYKVELASSDPATSPVFHEVRISYLSSGSGCVDGQPCDDGDACTTNDYCVGKTCVGGPPPNCDDANPCTDDTCNPESGCVHTDNTAPCDDGNACTAGDQCAGGSCVGGPPLNCDDANPCTDDTCNPESGCAHTNNTAPCDDGNACTANDTCAEGVCAGSCSAVGPQDPCCADQACSGTPVCETPVCIDRDGDGYGSPGSTACPHPETDCVDDPASDPPACASCSCGYSNCAACARCINPGAAEVAGDGIDSNCNGDADCFIATAAFGTPMGGKIDELRSLRDRHLLTSALGRSFVSAYYTYSPPIAAYISQRGWLKAIVRTLLLPLVGYASLLV